LPQGKEDDNAKNNCLEKAKNDSVVPGKLQLILKYITSLLLTLYLNML